MNSRQNIYAILVAGAGAVNSRLIKYAILWGRPPSLLLNNRVMQSHFNCNRAILVAVRG
jgi:hypothetical protein